MSNKKIETFSISLKDEFDSAACFNARERIGKIAGVSAMRSLPQGCFGIDTHRFWVDIEAQSAAADEIRRMPEVKAVKKGLNFG